jgi:hypothetical protein
VDLAISTYFDGLNSQRRLEMTGQSEERLSKALIEQLREPDDRLADIQEPDGREAWAGDGHHVQHACHDARVASKDGSMRYQTVNTIDLHDLRSGAVRPLEVCNGAEHEIKVLQRQNIRALKMRAARGAILVYNCSHITCHFYFTFPDTVDSCQPSPLPLPRQPPPLRRIPDTVDGDGTPSMPHFERHTLYEINVTPAIAETRAM